MEQYAAECIIERNLDPQASVALLVREFPRAFGSEAAFALTAVAVGLERPVLRSQASYLARRQGLFRCIALLACDICAVETLTGQRSTCAAISRHWDQTGEAFFVTPEIPDPAKSAANPVVN